MRSGWDLVQVGISIEPYVIWVWRYVSPFDASIWGLQ